MSEESLRKRVNRELELLREENDGFVKPEDVVALARKADSALHEDFAKQGLWDDKAAADRARLEYAGRIIRLYVIKPSEESKEPVRALVSLIDDRKVKEGSRGYRHISDVMGDEDLHEQLLQTALMELRAFKRKYSTLQGLAGVWNALDSIEREAKPKSEERATA